jgi:hypothetical protein
MGFQVVHIPVPKDLGPGPAQAAAVDDARMVQLVAQDKVSFSGNGRDDSGIRCIAGIEKDRGFSRLECGYPALQLFMQFGVPGDQS